MDDDVEIIRSNKGGMKIIHRGYMYTVHKKRRGGGIRWRCTQRSLHCKGSISTGSGTPRVNMPHNHIPDPHSVALARYRQIDNEEIGDVTALLHTECEETIEETMDCTDKEWKMEDELPRRRAHHHIYNKSFKRDVIRYAEKYGNEAAQKEFAIKSRNLKNWLRTRESIFNEFGRGRGRPRKDENQPPPPPPPQPPPPDDWDETLDAIPLQQRYEMCRSERLVETQSPNRLKVTRQSNRLDSTQSQTTLPVEEVCLRWNSHHSNLQNVFSSLLEREQYVDVTLSVENKVLKCHRMILSSCSQYFEEILAGLSPVQHPVIFLRNTPFWIVKGLVDFIYMGEVNIDHGRLQEFLDVAEQLKIKGLTNRDTDEKNEEKCKKKKTVKLPVKSPVLPTRTRSQVKAHARKRRPSTRPPDTCDPLKLLQPQEVKCERMRKRKSGDGNDEQKKRTRAPIKVPKYDEVKETSPAPPALESFSDIPVKCEPIDDYFQFYESDGNLEGEFDPGDLQIRIESDLPVMGFVQDVTGGREDLYEEMATNRIAIDETKEIKSNVLDESIEETKPEVVAEKQPPDLDETIEPFEGFDKIETTVNELVLSTDRIDGETIKM